MQCFTNFVINVNLFTYWNTDSFYEVMLAIKMAESEDGTAILTKLDIHEPPVLGSQLLQVLVRLATKEKQVAHYGPWPWPRGQLLPALIHRRHM
jgi:hypothetical protein